MRSPDTDAIYSFIAYHEDGSLEWFQKASHEGAHKFGDDTPSVMRITTPLGKPVWTRVS